MSRTSVIKQEILTILNDGRAHSASEIKEKIRQKSNEDISEGVFAGSFRTLVIEKMCENPDRGIYIINTKSPRKNEEVQQNEKPVCVKRNEAHMVLKQTVADSIVKLDTEICGAMKGIDISVADAEILEYCLEIKKICNGLREKINKANQILK